MTDRVAPEELRRMDVVLRQYAVQSEIHRQPLIMSAEDARWTAEQARRAALYIEKLEGENERLLRLVNKAYSTLVGCGDTASRTEALLRAALARTALQSTPIRGGERSTP